MRVVRRSALLAGTLGLAVTTAVALTPAQARAALSPGPATIPVHGILVVAQSDGPDGGSTSYAVSLAGGDIVPVRGSFDPSVRTGAVFDGRLALPASVTAALAARGAVADPRRAALRLVDRRSLTLSVVGTPSVEAAVAPAVTGTVHQQFVAAIDNKGTLGQDDPTLLGHVSTVGGYWQAESNGAISGLGTPPVVTHYATAVPTTDCGLSSAPNGDFFQVIQEAELKFPGINPFAGTDQLVVFVPSTCQSGTIVGEGTVGTSFANGGAMIVKAVPGTDGIYGHETGHNYGFEHANVRFNGASQEYFGIYDVMGFALPAQFNMLTALSTPFRVFQGITDPGEIQDVPLGDQTQPVHVSATVRPRSDTTGLRSLRVVDPATGQTLYLDYRSGTGRDVGAAYAQAGGVGLALDATTTLRYRSGLVITSARGAPASGVDDLVLDAADDTSLVPGGTWTNAAGNLAIHVSSAGPTGAVVSVDFTPATQDFTTETPVIGGNVVVGGTVTLAVGTWSPAPTTTTIRWTANGSPVPNSDDKTSFVPSPALVGQQLVATVTGSRSGFRTASAQSAPVTVSPGTIPLFTAPTITGTAQVGSVLHGHVATWGSTLSLVTEAWQWRAGGVDIPGATGLDYTVKPGDVGTAITLVERLSSPPAYQTLTTESLPTAVVPAPVISPAPTPTVSGTPRVGTPLTAQAGSWMPGVALGFQWYVGGSPVAGATGTSYIPQAGDLGQSVRVDVTGSRAGYPTVSRSSAGTSAVAPGVLSTATPTIKGTPAVGRTLTAKHGAWTPGTTFSYAWFADGVRIKRGTGPTLVLAKAQRGKRIKVTVTGAQSGYTGASRTSARTVAVR